MTYKQRDPKDIALADGYEDRRGVPPGMPEIDPKQARRERVRESLREAMEKKKEKEAQIKWQPQPRYDEVFYEGLAWLDGEDELGLLDEQLKEYRSMMDDFPPGEECRSCESVSCAGCVHRKEFMFGRGKFIELIPVLGVNIGEELPLSEQSFL